MYLAFFLVTLLCVGVNMIKKTGSILFQNSQHFIFIGTTTILIITLIIKTLPITTILAIVTEVYILILPGYTGSLTHN